MVVENTKSNKIENKFIIVSELVWTILLLYFCSKAVNELTHLEKNHTNHINQPCEAPENSCCVCMKPVYFRYNDLIKNVVVNMDMK